MSDSVEILKTEQAPEYAADDGYKLNVADKRLALLSVKLQHRFNELQSYTERSDWERDMAEAFKAYHMIPDDTKDLPWPGAANLRCVLPRIGVDSAHANVMYAIFGNGNRAMVGPKVIRPGLESQAKRTAQCITYQLEHEADFYMVMDDADRKAQMYGIAYLEPRYCKEYAWETRKVTESNIEPVVGEDGQLTGELKETKKSRTEKHKRVTFDGIKIESLDPKSILVSPFMKDLDEAVLKDVVFKKLTRTWESIQRQARKGPEGEEPFYRPDAVDAIEPTVLKRVLRVADSELEAARAKLDGFLLDYQMGAEMVDLVEAHLWFDIDGDDIPEKIVATFEPQTGTVLRVTLAPCRIVDFKPRPVDGRFYGEGIPKSAKQICDEWEAIHNTRVNAGQWENSPFGFYNAGGRLNPEEIQIRPGHFYPVSNANEVVFAQTPTVRQSYFNEEGLLMNYFERCFALSENIQGVQSARASTATESLNTNQRSSIRLANPLTRIVMSLEKLVGHMVDLNRECAPEEKEFAIVGAGPYPLFDKVYKQDYQAQMSYKLDISTIFDEQLERDRWMLVYRMFIQDPNVAQHPAVMYELSTKTLESVGVSLNIPKPEQAKVLSPEEEHEIIQRGEAVEPNIGDDDEEHMRSHMAVLKSDAIKEWSPEAIKDLMLHYDKHQIQKKTKESANLNQSGVFVPPAGMGDMSQMPGMTASRNPSQAFNTLRVGETSKSMENNASNNVPGYGSGQ